LSCGTRAIEPNTLSKAPTTKLSIGSPLFRGAVGSAMMTGIGSGCHCGPANSRLGNTLELTLCASFSPTDSLFEAADNAAKSASEKLEPEGDEDEWPAGTEYDPPEAAAAEEIGAKFGVEKGFEEAEEVEDGGAL
jgi:hypothetical protein